MKIGIGLSLAVPGSAAGAGVEGPVAPTNTTAPSISGTATVGETLTASEGTWTGSPTLTLQWLRDGAEISGASGASYTLVTADDGATISLRVTGTNAGGSATAVSASVGPVGAAEVPVLTLALSPAEPVAGDEVIVSGTVSGGSASDFAAFSATIGGEEINVTGTGLTRRMVVSAGTLSVLASVSIGGTTYSASAGAEVGPAAETLSPPAAFGASDWSFATAAATGQAVLALSAIPEGATFVDYTFDGGTTVHTLLGAATGERYIPALTPDQSYSCQVRARNSAGASAWASAKSAVAGAIKGAAATAISTVPASGAKVYRYHINSQLSAADGTEVLSLSSLGDACDLANDTGLVPVIRTDTFGRKFIRFEGASTTGGLKNDATPLDIAEFAAFVVCRPWIKASAGSCVVVNTQGSATALLGMSKAYADRPANTTVHGGPVSSFSFDTGISLGGLTLVGALYRRSTAPTERHYIGRSRAAGGGSKVSTAGQGIRLPLLNMDVYEVVLVNGTLTTAEGDAIADSLCDAWGIVSQTDALALEGDSITNGVGITTGNWNMPQIVAGLANMIPANCKFDNTATSGHKIENIIAQRDAATNWMTVGMSPVRNSMVLQIGRNNQSESLAAIKSKYISYFTGETGVLARGLNVQVVGNINDTSPIATMTALRDWLASGDFLTEIGAGPGQQYEGRVKVVSTWLAEDGGITPLAGGVAGSGAYYVDGVHPNEDGTRVMITGGDTPQYGSMTDVA